VERVDKDDLRDRVQSANSRVQEILSRARGALEGREDFTAQEIRALSEPLREMREIVSRSADLRATDAALDAELDRYGATLEELQTNLEQVRFMLLARKAHLSATHGHIERVTLWTEALKQTR
jgi:hypothetical protein